MFPPYLKVWPGNGSPRYIGACSAPDYEANLWKIRQTLGSVGGRVVEKEVEFFVKDNGSGDPVTKRSLISFIEPKRSKQKGRRGWRSSRR